MTFDLKSKPEQPVISEPQAKPATTYDLAPPAALLDFMKKNWKAPSAKPSTPVKHAAAFFERVT